VICRPLSRLSLYQPSLATPVGLCKLSLQHFHYSVTSISVCIIIITIIIIRPHCMHSRDAAYCDRCHTQHGLCVCLFVGHMVSCAKVAEPVGMKFGG